MSVEADAAVCYGCEPSCPEMAPEHNLCGTPALECPKGQYRAWTRRNGDACGVDWLGCVPCPTDGGPGHD